MKTILRTGLILMAGLVVAGVAWLAVDKLGSGMAMPDRPAGVAGDLGDLSSDALVVTGTEGAEGIDGAQAALFAERGERGERPGGGLMAFGGVLKSVVEMVLITTIVIAATRMWERLRRKRRHAAAVA